MISNQRMLKTLEEIKEISRVDLALFADTGKLAAATYEPGEELNDAVSSFAESMAESQRMSGSHFFKVIAGGELQYILVTASDAEDAYMVGRLAVCQIRNMTAAYTEQYDRNHFMQNILLGNMLLVDMYNRAQKLHIAQTERTVFVVEIEHKKDSDAMELMKNLFSPGSGDYITELDDDSIILIKDTGNMPDDDDLSSLADVIVDNLQTEAMVRVRVGYGSRVTELKDIAKSYQEAMMALEVGRIFYMEKKIISYEYLGIGRIIYQLPVPLCERFIHEVFGDEVPDIFNEETTVTVQKFFENNLNISETARQLYVHRNTLVYRLERLQKAIGLDIRRFDDAMTFKIAMMILAYINSRK